MFAIAPLAPRVEFRVVPVATLVLVVAIAAASAWIQWATATAGAATAATMSDVAATWGYRHGAEWPRALSALFVHADALHLFTNLVALALAGACLEQAWGGARTAFLFLIAGATAIAFDARAAGSTHTIVGASAGVSALLGACFVRFRHRRVRFVYVYLEYLRPRTGRVRISCAALGVAWAAQQSLGAAWSACSGDDRVAFASHVAGTAAGIAFAMAHEARQRRLRAR